MKQASLKLNLNVKKTRKQVFLEQMGQVVPWAALVELIAPYYPDGKTGRPPFFLQTMLRVHFMQQWFTLSDLGIRAKVEQPFRVIKRQFGYVKVRYRGLKKNTAQLVTLFALSNL